MKKTLTIIFLITLIVILSGCIKDEPTNNSITNFEECVNAGYPVMESYPRQCRTPDGIVFVEEIEQNNIGGERDEHGCLGPAGYSWGENIQACTKNWELNENQQEAAKLAVEYIGSGKYLTVTKVDVLRCPGCFIVELEKGEQRDIISVEINDWEITSKTLARHTCTEQEKQTEICTMEYAPVCGFKLDGAPQTYGNDCQACADGIEYWETGEC